ncbi:TetR/AcrR family transcriptional regulator [Pseudomonas chlororaphis]|uniref:TetR/AcrR family transcriptional regulator n=1 Tax=Pseudomonas chlororaphis TaxID=587753 RepID=UPI000F56F4D0|nr:TetR/AcrR family transcriptional regulator [Pseudomonas chlororaphis]AZC95069.1 Transcriptional regulator NfxB [Pseudomonas chlororaphis subsp. piscium]
MSSPASDEKLLKALAVAIVDHPWGTLKELAEAAGVSKATLHRFCGTRDNLIEMLMSHTCEVMKQIIETADLHQAAPAVALRNLIQLNLAQRELLLFMVFQYRPDTMAPNAEGNRWQPCIDALDGFFLRAQQEGYLRIDVSAPVLSDLFMTLICGIVDSERLGRAAPASSALVLEQMFLHGAATPSS